MFYNEFQEPPYSRYQLLCRKVTGFYEYEERYLSHVKNANIVDVDAFPIPEEVRTFFAERFIPEKKAEFIAASYKAKLELLRKFQSGKKVKAYLEKSHEKQHG